MKTTALMLVLFACVGQAYAAKSCDELKTEIAGKLDKQAVKAYELAIVESDKVGAAKVVGSCETGKKKITYLKK